MEQNVIEKKSTSSLLKSVIAESKKIRDERGDDFFDIKRSITINDTEKVEATSKIQSHDGRVKSEKDFSSIRDSHVKLNRFIVEYDQKIFDQNNRVLDKKKKR